jgi:hypothetical protein
MEEEGYWYPSAIDLILERVNSYVHKGEAANPRRGTIDNLQNPSPTRRTSIERLKEKLQDRKHKIFYFEECTGPTRPKAQRLPKEETSLQYLNRILSSATLRFRSDRIVSGSLNAFYGHLGITLDLRARVSSRTHGSKGF